MTESSQEGPGVEDDLFPELYDDLRRLAARYLRSERSGHTLQSTALVHEAWVRLHGDQFHPRDRARFYCVAARTMRHILINHARDKGRLKRGGGAKRVALDVSHVAGESQQEVDLVSLGNALDELAAQDASKALLVELRYFAGLDNKAAAEALEISVSTLKREWTAAKAWLRHFIERDLKGGSPLD